MNIVRVEAYTQEGKRVSTTEIISKQGLGLWVARLSDFSEDALVDYAIAYDPDGRAERVPMTPLKVPAGGSMDLRIQQMVQRTKLQPVIPADPTDLLERLKGNGRPWTFVEIIAEIEKLRKMRMDVRHYASCLEAAHIAGPPEYDFDDEKEFLAKILEAVL